MDGFEVATRIRETRDGKNVLLVALTGYGHEQVVERAVTSGFDHHLLKPAEPATIERLLAGER
jgi:CheY-like chemotaxis protein